MKRITLLTIAAVCGVASAFSQVDNGYYRVQNVEQGRYISVVDYRGSINVSTTDADMGALKTLAGGFERVVSDPSTVIYFNQKGTGYDLQTQGTSSYAIIGYTLTISKNSDGTYYAYASNSGMTKYLADQLKSIWDTEGTDGSVVTNSKDTRKWYIQPVTPDNSYFGFKPDVDATGGNYKSFYASFPFTFSSTGMNAYYVTKVDAAKSAVVISELTGGVPAATPVIVKCSSAQPADNKINVGATVSGSVTGNQLKGVYFCNDVLENSGHRNVVDYDMSTMRVLGTASDGSLAFVKSTELKYIPANTAYITVDDTAPDVLKVYTQAEYDALPTTVKGDLSGDGSVDAQDFTVVVNMILGKRAMTTDADLNGDGSVDAQDLVIMVNIILGRN